MMLTATAREAYQLGVGDSVHIRTVDGTMYSGDIVEIQGRKNDGHARRLVDGDPQCVIEIYYTDNGRPQSVELSFEDGSSVDIDEIQ